MLKPMDVGEGNLDGANLYQPLVHHTVRINPMNDGLPTTATPFAPIITFSIFQFRELRVFSSQRRGCRQNWTGS